MLEVSLGLLVVAAALVSLWVQRRYHYWCDRGLLQPPTVFGFGHMLDAVLMRSNAGLIHEGLYRKYSDQSAVGVYHFLKPKLLLLSPELIKRVLVSDFSSFHDNEFEVNKKLDPYFCMDPFALKGDEWKPSRMKLMSTMTNSRLKEIFSLMKTAVPRLLAYVDDHLVQDIDAKELSTLFTMDSVSNAVFGIESNCFTDTEAPFRKMGLIQSEEFKGGFVKTVIMMYMPTLRDLLGFSFFPKKVSKFVKKMIEDVVEYKLTTNSNGVDVLQHCMKREKVTEKSDLTDIIGFGTIFFIEGFETSSMVASITLYELAMNPRMQDTLYEEVSKAFGESTEPDFETINSLKYLDKVLQESQRLYPIAYEVVRECTKTICLEIDGKSVNIEKGTPVIIPIYAIHHDSQYYPNPEVFDPERFDEGSKAARPLYTYMPFGEGPRMCPGMKFALAQIKLFIATLVLNYKILRSEKTPPKLTLLAGSPMVIPNETEWIRFEKR